MDFKGMVFSIILFSWLLLSWTKDVKVVIQGANLIAKIDDNFVCATMDWWPTEKTGLFDLDLKKKNLVNAIKAFNPLRTRVGGSLQNQVVYNVGRVKKCHHFKKRKNGLFGFSQGCLSMTRWDELNNFFIQTGAKVTFGLNALIGRKKSNIENGLWVGDWKSQNAREFMNYSISKGYKIDSYEFGNGLCGRGIGARVKAKQYGKDVIALKNLVKELNPDPKTQPKVLGPSGFYDNKWFNTFLKVSGHGVVDAITHHIYNLGPSDDPNLITKIQDPFYLNQVAQTYKKVSKTVKKFGPLSGAWVSEAGGVSDNGHKNVSPTFADGFWYLDQLGMASTFNHKIFCRQTFIGGNYALFNTTTFTPNPDYYGALLWHRLMGSNVLSVTQKVNPNLRVYAHCAKKNPGISLLFINLSKDKMSNVTLLNDQNIVRLNLKSRGVVRPNFEFRGYQNREEYHLTPLDGDILSDIVLLNDVPLNPTDSLDIPGMDPKFVDASSPISIALHSIVFVTIRDFNAPACA
ncbi:hypothetical protein PTKIN_Ptkin02bG0010600 [Pterospermum kingtungense]